MFVLFWLWSHKTSWMSIFSIWHFPFASFSLQVLLNISFNFSSKFFKCLGCRNIEVTVFIGSLIFFFGFLLQIILYHSFQMFLTASHVLFSSSIFRWLTHIFFQFLNPFFGSYLQLINSFRFSFYDVLRLFFGILTSSPTSKNYSELWTY